MKKIRFLFFTLLIATALPLVSLAQETSSDPAANPAQSPTGELGVPATAGKSPSPTVSPSSSASPGTAPRKVNVIVTATSSGNNRFLGGVSIKIDGADFGETPDPPPPRGYTIPNVPAGKHEIIAERKLGNGYKIYDENVTVPDTKSNFELAIKLEPAAGTYAVKDSDIRQSNQATQYLTNPQQLYGSYYPNPTTYNQYTPQYWNNNSSVLNPFNNYPNYNNPNSQYAGLNNFGQYYNQNYNTQYSPYANQQYPYNNPAYYNPAYQYPNNYYLSSAQANSVQFKLTADASRAVTTGNGIAEIKIYDAQNTSLYNLQSAIPYLTSSDSGSIFNRYGCLAPNRNYVLQIDIRRTDGTQFQPIQKGFTSPNPGDIVEIYVDWGAVLSGNTNAIASRNTQLVGNPDPNFATFRCPSSYYQNQNLNGPTIFSDPTLNLQNMGNYQMVRDYRNGDYYLSNSNNYWDSRRISFVDRGDGLGGLAFFSASPNGYYGLNVGLGGDLNFYVGLYNRNTNGDLSISNNQFYQTGVSPNTYSSYVYNKNVQTFPNYYNSLLNVLGATNKTSVKIPKTSSSQPIPTTSTGGGTIPTTSTGKSNIPTTSTGGGTIPTTSTGNGSIPTTSTGGGTIPTTSTGTGEIPTTSTGAGTIPTTSTNDNGPFSINPNPFLDPFSSYV